MFITNNRTSFHLWWKEDLVKYQKVSKYYENNWLFQFYQTISWISSRKWLEAKLKIRVGDLKVRNKETSNELHASSTRCRFKNHKHAIKEEVWSKPYKHKIKELLQLRMGDTTAFRKFSNFPKNCQNMTGRNVLDNPLH